MIPENVTALARWPKVAEALKAAPVVPTQLAPTPQQTLVVGGLFLTSGYNRLGEAQHQAQMIKDGQPDGWCYGIGLGELPATALARVEKLHVVIMNRAIARASLSAVRHGWLEDPRVELHLAGDLPEAYGPFTLNPMEVRQVDEDGYRVRDQISMVMNVEMNRKFAAVRKETEDANRAANAEHIASDSHVSALYGSAKDKPAIVCMGGPTLAQHYDWIRPRRETHLVIAASTALRPLLSEGIFPDVVCVMDSSPQMVKHFEVMPARNSALVYLELVSPPVVNGWKGPRYHAQMDLADDGSAVGADLYPGGSVLFMGVDLARKMGVRRVYLVGADLCFPGAKSHVDGAPQPMDVSQGWRIPIVNGRGERVMTEEALSFYRVTLEDFVATHPEVEWVKLGRDGCEIKGMVWHE